jgi:hypothetical protein
MKLFFTEANQVIEISCPTVSTFSTAPSEAVAAMHRAGSQRSGMMKHIETTITTDGALAEYLSDCFRNESDVQCIVSKVKCQMRLTCMKSSAGLTTFDATVIPLSLNLDIDQ